MKIYHYAQMVPWAQRNVSNKHSGKNDGLRPQRNMGRDDREAWSTKGIFGLFSPEPGDWANNPEFPRAWEDLQRHVGRMLVEIDVDENDPEAFVVDWAPKEYLLLSKLEGRETGVREVAERQYMESKIRLKDYLARKDVLKYSLPEVILSREVKPEQMRISESQPLLERDFEEYKDAPAIIQNLEYDISLIPEMQEWYKKYREQRESNRETRTGRR